MQKFLILALCVAATTAASVSVNPFSVNAPSIFTPKGVVNPVNRCGGVATFLELRVTGCEGICNLQPGTKYDIECDMIPSTAAPSLTLKVEATVFGSDVTILETILPNSSVQPGQRYTVLFAITPNDILSGQTVIITSSVSRTIPSHILELCIQQNIIIN